MLTGPSPHVSERESGALCGVCARYLSNIAKLPKHFGDADLQFVASVNAGMVGKSHQDFRMLKNSADDQVHFCSILVGHTPRYAAPLSRTQEPNRFPTPSAKLKSKRIKKWVSLSRYSLSSIQAQTGGVAH